MQKVKQGDPFQPSSDFTNDTVDVINAFKAGGMNQPKGDTASRFNANTVLVSNGTDADVEPLHPLALTGELVTDDLTAERPYQVVAYQTSTPVSTDDTVVVIQNNIKTGTDAVVKAVISGVTPAYVDVKDASDGYATVGATGKLESTSTATKIKILWSPSAAANDSMCLIMLGAGGGSGGNYNGMFKVINTSDANSQKIKIIDGLDSTATNAGRLQVNQFMVDIPVPELTLTNEACIYFEAVLIMDSSTPPVATGATVTIKQGAIPSYTADKAVQIISRTLWENNKIKDFSREPISQQMIIFEPCPVPEVV